MGRKQNHLSRTFFPFGVASPVSEAFGRVNGTGHGSGGKAHKFVQRIEIGKPFAWGIAGIAFSPKIGGLRGITGIALG
jgi:hypothetical protein